MVLEEEAAERRQLSQAGKRGDEAGRRPPVEYGVMQFALTCARLGGWGVRVRERRRRNAGEAAAAEEAAESTVRPAPFDSCDLDSTGSTSTTEYWLRLLASPRCGLSQARSSASSSSSSGSCCSGRRLRRCELKNTLTFILQESKCPICSFLRIKRCWVALFSAQ